MTAQLPPSRILLVEDHADTAEVFARLLESRGFRVMAANTAASGLALARRLPFDVLLCDIQLPDGDGYALLLKLRGELGMDALVAIAFSGYGDQEDVERAKAAGFDAYMLKPIEIGQFFGVLEQLCRCERPPRALAREFITVLTCATEGTGEAAQN